LEHSIFISLTIVSKKLMVHEIRNSFSILMTFLSPFQKMNPQLPMEVENPLLILIKRNMVLENLVLVIPVQKKHLLQPVQKK